MWPSLVDTSKEECCQILRSLELDAFSRMVTVLRAQGHYNAEKKRLLADVGIALNIPLERHKAEIRRAANDEHLNTIANKYVIQDGLVGPNTMTEWAMEGRRLLPLLPRPPQKTVYTLVADETADLVASVNARLLAPSETASQPSDYPFITEPASPEPSRTTANDPNAPVGVLVLPSGTAYQMKRDVAEEVVERKRRRISGSEMVTTPTKLTIQTPRTAVGTPLKISLPSRNFTPTTASKQVIIVSNNSSAAAGPTAATTTPVQTPVAVPPPSILHKTLSGGAVAVKGSSTGTAVAVGGNKVIYTEKGRGAAALGAKVAVVGGADSGSPQQQQQQQQQSTKQRLNAVAAVKVGGKQAVATPQSTTTFLLQPKGGGGGGGTAATAKTVVVQQKAGTTILPAGATKGLASVQVKTPQGFTSVALRPIHSPVKAQTPIKSATAVTVDSGKQPAAGAMKMLSITSGGTAKILPKPAAATASPLYVVTASSTPLTMVTRTIPATSASRVVTVPSSKWPAAIPNNSNNTSTVKTVHVVAKRAAVATASSADNNIVVLPAGKTVKVAATTGGGGKESAAAVVKATTIGKSPMAAKQNLILLDLSQQESGTFAELIQTTSSSTTTAAVAVAAAHDKTKERGDDSKEEVIVVDGEEQKSEKTDITSLSIEEAVEMLNKSDTPATRALLSQAGIQISDEIADSEDEEHQQESTPTAVRQDDEQMPQPTKANGSSDGGSAATAAAATSTATATVVAPALAPTPAPTPASTSASASASAQQVATTTTPLPATSTSSQQQQPPSAHVSSHLTMSTRGRALDIFSTALASANINLDNFMEEEDEPDTEEKQCEVKTSGKASDQKAALTLTDAIDVQLAQLTSTVDH